jgi:hypothetical protein
MKEYIGCRVDRVDGNMKLTQPVLLQSLEDEFDQPPGTKTPTMPATPGEVLHLGTETRSSMLNDEMQSK